MLRAGRKQILRATLGLLLLIGLYYFRKQVVNVLSVFALTVGISVILSPVCKRLENIGMCSGIASFISVCLLVVLSIFVVGILFPYTAAHLLAFVKKNSPLLVTCITQAGAWLEEFGIGSNQWTHLTKILANSIAGTMKWIAHAGATVTASVGKFSIASVMSYYILSDRKVIGRHLLLIIPFTYRASFLTVMNSAKNAFMGYLSGTIKTSMFVFIASYSGLLLLRIPDAFVLSMQMSLLEVLPYIGPFFATIPILLSAASGGISKMIYALILVIAVQQIEGSFAGPYFTASSTAVHPFAALSGVFVFGAFFGIWGVLLAVPVLTIVQSVSWSIIQTRAKHQT